MMNLKIVERIKPILTEFNEEEQLKKKKNPTYAVSR